MTRTDRGDLIFFHFENLSEFNDIQHFVTCRKGGLSSYPYDSLNLSYESGDNKDIVLKNRELMAIGLDITLSSFVFQHQIHSNNVFQVNKSHKGRGLYNQSDCISDNDALISSEKGICLFVFAGDCVPILFFDPVKKVIAASHAGWKGTVKKIAVSTVQKMIETYGCSRFDIHIGIGPSIGPCCYEVGDEVYEEALKSFGTDQHYFTTPNQKGKRHFNLWYANGKQLQDYGVPAYNILTCKICTSCNQDYFYSARGCDQNTGRFGAGIILT
jgi:polyphenol oxidase